MNAFNATGFAAIAVVLSSCRDQVSTNTNTAQIERRIEDIEKQNASMLEDLKKLEKLASETEYKRYRDQLLASDLADLDPDLASVYKFRKLNTSSPEFDYIDIGWGHLLVSVEGVDKYLDGYKINLSIGNPNYAQLNGLNVDVQYGKLELDLPKDKKWEDMTTRETDDIIKQAHCKLKKQSVKCSETLKSGTWTKIAIILPNADTEDMKLITYRVNASSISLTK